MFVVLENSKKVLTLLEILKVIKNLSQHVSMTFRESELYIQILDNSHICLFDISIQKEWFDKYDVGEEEEIISVDVSILVKIINLFTCHSNVTITCNEKHEKLIIILQSAENEKSFEIPMMEIEFEFLKTSDNDYSCDFEMNTKILEKYIQELMIFGEVMNLRYANEELNISTSGSEGKMNLKITNDKLESLCVEENKKIKSVFDIKYIHYISKLSSCFKNIGVSFDDSYPLYCHLSDTDIELKYFIAPKFDDYEDDDDDELDNEVISSVDIE